MKKKQKVTNLDKTITFPEAMTHHAEIFFFLTNVVHALVAIEECDTLAQAKCIAEMARKGKLIRKGSK